MIRATVFCVLVAGSPGTAFNQIFYDSLTTG